jgi:hypothetical protein
MISLKSLWELQAKIITDLSTETGIMILFGPSFFYGIIAND